MELNNGITPGKAAQQWAKAHPDFVGKSQVLSNTRKGRGGWGVTRRENTFFVNGGHAVTSRDDRKKSTFNGGCEFCGHVYLNRVLSYAHGADPDAGETFEYDHYFEGKVMAQYAERAIGRACPCCISKHNLTIGWVGYGLRLFGDKPYLYYRQHPLVTYSELTIPSETLILGEGRNAINTWHQR